MDVSGVSPSALALDAMQMSGQKVQLQLATSVMKSIQDSQERQAQALIEMMKQMTPGVGQNIDIRA